MTTYDMTIGGLTVCIEANLTEAAAPVRLTLLTSIPVAERSSYVIGQTADARHSEAGLRELAESHLRAEGVLSDEERYR